MFRLRLSNNRLEDLNTMSLLTQANRNKLNQISDTNLIARSKSSNQKILIGSSTNPKTNSSRNSSFNYYSTSSTPEKLLPVIKKSKRNSVIKKSAQYSSILTPQEAYQDPSTNASCDCILCNSQMKKQNFIQLNSNDMFLIDSKNFINCLNRMKPTIKLDRESHLNDPAYSMSRNSSDFSSSSNNTLIKFKNSNQILKLLPATSRIKLWDQNDVMNYINTEETRNVIKEPKKSQSAINREVFEASKNETESRLSKILKEFRINPNFTPLIYKANHTATIGFQDHEPIKAITLDISAEKKKQIKVPAVRILPKSPSNSKIMYKVPMNSALAFYDC